MGLLRDYPVQMLGIVIVCCTYLFITANSIDKQKFDRAQRLSIAFKSLALIGGGISLFGMLSFALISFLPSTLLTGALVGIILFGGLILTTWLTTSWLNQTTKR